jgi:glyoxylate reductase
MRCYSTWELPGETLNRLKSVGFTVKVNNKGRLLTGSEIMNAAAEADALITQLTDQITAEILLRNNHLRIIANVAAGYNNIDVPEATRRKIWVTNTPKVLSGATAEIALTLILMVMRKALPAEAFVRSGNFAGWRPHLFVGSGLSGKTAGIYGMGNIGREIANRLLPFGVKIIYHNRQPLEKSAANGASYVSFDQLLVQSDILIVQAPLNDDSRHRFGAAEFAAMKESCVFINTGRGAIHREADLVTALRERHIAGAGLDVYENEPEIHPDLLNMENVVLFPHIGSAARETREAMFELAASNVVNCFTDIPLLTAVNEI